MPVLSHEGSDVGIRRGVIIPGHFLPSRVFCIIMGILYTN